MATKSEQFEELRQQFALDNGSVDDVLEKLEGRHEILTSPKGLEFAFVTCPFEDVGCDFALTEGWSEEGDEEGILVATAAHMLTGHLEYEEGEDG